jgi:Arc/MetJ family transcription regulator
MRTNIDIDDELIAEAMELSGLRTKKAVVEQGLRRLITLERQARAIEDMAGLGWDDGLGTRDEKHRSAAE